jgi:hypothetical protein
MDAKWLSVQSMKLNQSIIGAINILSIHFKLALRQMEDVKSQQQIGEAKTVIQDWIVEFDRNLSAYEQNSYQALAGVSPRQQQLVKRFEAAKRKGEFSSKLFCENPQKLIELMSAKEPAQITELLQSLNDLRILLEEHNQMDIQNLVPDL